MITLLLHLLRLSSSAATASSPSRTLPCARLSVYKRTTTRPKLRTTDRLFWIGLTRAWAGWRQALVIVTPDTVLRWQRRRFRKYWTQLSGRSTGGRPPVNAEIRALVTRMATANLLWGAPRIHGELLKIGIEVAERPVSRLMPQTASPGAMHPHVARCHLSLGTLYRRTGESEQAREHLTTATTMYLEKNPTVPLPTPRGSR